MPPGRYQSFRDPPPISRSQCMTRNLLHPQTWFMMIYQYQVDMMFVFSSQPSQITWCSIFPIPFQILNDGPAIFVRTKRPCLNNFSRSAFRSLLPRYFSGDPMDYSFSSNDSSICSLNKYLMMYTLTQNISEVVSSIFSSTWCSSYYCFITNVFKLKLWTTYNIALLWWGRL